jgi:flagellin
MALAIATNNAALRAAAAASGVNRDMETSMARLSSGKRINSASDDAAGVAISSRLTANIRGTDQAIRNALDGQALIDTAEGAHKEIENILQRMREVSVQAANDTNNQQDRDNLQAEMDAMSTEIDRIAATTTWAGAKMLDTDGSTFNFHIGAGVSNQDHIDVNIGAMTSSALGLGGSTSSGGNLIEITGATFASGQFTALVDDNEVTDTGVTVTFDATDNALTVTGTATRAAHLEIDLSSASGNVLLTTVTLNIGDTQETIAAAIKTAIDNVSSALAPVTATADTVAGTVTIDGADFEDIASETVDGFTIGLTSNVIAVTGTANTNGTLTLDAAVSSTYDDGADVLVSYNNGDDAAAITNAIKAAIDDVVGSMTGGTTTLISGSSSSSSSSSPSSSRTVNNAISGQGTNSIMAVPAQSGASGIDLVIGSVTVTGIDISTGDAAAAAALITSAINDGNGSPGSGDGTAAHGVTATDALDGAGNINLSFTGGATAGDVAAYVSGSGSSSSASHTHSPTLDSPSNAMTAITAIDTAIEKVNIQRSKLGAVSNRLSHTVNNLTNISANLSAARGGIEDADFAFETTHLAKNQILQQASTAMLAQANASKQNVLSLLQG